MSSHISIGLYLKKGLWVYEGIQSNNEYERMFEGVRKSVIVYARMQRVCVCKVCV